MFRCGLVKGKSFRMCLARVSLRSSGRVQDESAHFQQVEHFRAAGQLVRIARGQSGAGAAGDALKVVGSRLQHVFRAGDACIVAHDLLDGAVGFLPGGMPRVAFTAANGAQQFEREALRLGCFGPVAEGLDVLSRAFPGDPAEHRRTGDAAEKFVARRVQPLERGTGVSSYRMPPRGESSLSYERNSTGVEPMSSPSFLKKSRMPQLPSFSSQWVMYSTPSRSRPVQSIYTGPRAESR